MTSHGGSIRLLPADRGVAFELEFPAALAARDARAEIA